jgi:hypothetical protein
MIDRSNNMIRKMILAGAAIAVLASPVLAADAAFFIAKDAATKKCAVVAAKPDEKAAMMIGKVSYKTKVEAETAMKAAADCK